MKIQEKTLRRELMTLLQSKNAHMSFEDVVADFPLSLINAKLPNTPYSAWHLLEHMRIAQWDILEFIRNPEHVSPDYPEGYRPPAALEVDERTWFRTIERFDADLKALQKIALDPAVDLFAPIPHATGYTIFRELLLAADHNAYHVGEIALLRQELKAWPEEMPYLSGQGISRRHTGS